MDIGPVEYVVIEFPGNRFNGGILPALTRLLESGTVRIIDLVFVIKDADGNVASFEYDELEDAEAFAGVEGEADGMLSDEDVLAIAEDLHDDSSALLIMFEDLWAGEFAQAVRASGGELVAGGRVPRELIDALEL
ncbi:MAG: DUF6325 family protein [Ilumatobacteraceae bacterium]